MRLPSLGILIGLLAVTACDAPRFEGPAVQALPGGFIREPEAAQDHEIFPERGVMTRDAYVVFGAMEFSGFYIRKHSGGTTRSAVDDARIAAAAVEAVDGVTYGEVEDVVVDGNAAWGWIEERHDSRGLQSVEYRIVVPYADSVTYTIEFTSAKYNWMSNPDSMRSVATSFAVGKVVWDYQLIGLIAVGGFLVLSFLWNMVKTKNPSTNYSLSQAARPTPDGESPPAPSDPAPRNPATDTQTPPRSGA